MREVDTTQRFPLPAAAVAAAFRNPGLFARFAAVRVLDQPEVLEISEIEIGKAWRVRVRYRFVGELGHPLVAKVVDPQRLTWVEETVVDHTGSGIFTVVPDHYARLLGFSGRIDIAEASPGTATRRLRGALKLNLPLLARPFASAAEGAIGSGLAEAAQEQVAIVVDFVNCAG